MSQLSSGLGQLQPLRVTYTGPCSKSQRSLQMCFESTTATHRATEVMGAHTQGRQPLTQADAHCHWASEVTHQQNRQEPPATWRESVRKLYVPVLKKPHWTPGYCLCSWAISSLKCFTARTAKYRSLLAFLHTSISAAKLLRLVSTVPLKTNTAAATYKASMTLVKKEKTRKDCAFWRHFDEKLSIIPGSPGA